MGKVNDKPPKQDEVSEKRSLKELYPETLNLSSHKAAQIVKVSSTLVRDILKLDLKLKPYKPNTYFQILTEHYPKRVEFCNWALVLPLGTHNWFIFYDEAWFYLTQKQNKQNNRSWLPEHPTDSPHPPKRSRHHLQRLCVPDGLAGVR